MLSSTNTITDIKTELENDYTFYDYSTDNLFSAQLTLRATDAKLQDIIPVISESLYDQIATKDKVNLTTNETYIYRAEIYFSCARFLKNKSLKENEANSGGFESISTEGYTRQLTPGMKSGKEETSDYYFKLGKDSLALAGYKSTLQLRRGNSQLSGFDNSVESWFGL